MEPTSHEIQVLEEMAGLKPASPWGAWVGACIDFLQEGGFLTRGNHIKLTEKGRTFLKARHPGWQPTQEGST